MFVIEQERDRYCETHQEDDRQPKPELPSVEDNSIPIEIASNVFRKIFAHRRSRFGTVPAHLPGLP